MSSLEQILQQIQALRDGAGGSGAQRQEQQAPGGASTGGERLAAPPGQPANTYGASELRAQAATTAEQAPGGGPALAEPQPVAPTRPHQFEGSGQQQELQQQLHEEQGAEEQGWPVLSQQEVIDLTFDVPPAPSQQQQQQPQSGGAGGLGGSGSAAGGGGSSLFGSQQSFGASRGPPLRHTSSGISSGRSGLSDDVLRMLAQQQGMGPADGGGGQIAAELAQQAQQLADQAQQPLGWQLDERVRRLQAAQQAQQAQQQQQQQAWGRLQEIGSGEAAMAAALGLAPATSRPPPVRLPSWQEEAAELARLQQLPAPPGRRGQRVHPMLEPVSPTSAAVHAAHAAQLAAQQNAHAAVQQPQQPQQARQVPASFSYPAPSHRQQAQQAQQIQRAASGSKIYLPTSGGRTQVGPEGVAARGVPLSGAPAHPYTITSGGGLPHSSSALAPSNPAQRAWVEQLLGAKERGAAVYTSPDGSLLEVAEVPRGRPIPASFQQHLSAVAPTLGSGGAAQAVAIQRELQGRGAAGPAAGLRQEGLGQRLLGGLGGMGPVLGGANTPPYTGGSVYALQPPPSFRPGGPIVAGGGTATTTTFVGSLGVREPAPDSRKALKAVMDGLEVAGIKEEKDAPEGALLVPLMRHQKLALAWMVKRETSGNQPIGGILADDQGLGKTVSTIALIATERPDLARQGTRCNAAPPARRQQRAAKRARSASAASLGASHGTGGAGGSVSVSQGGSAADQSASQLGAEPSGSQQLGPGATTNVPNGRATSGSSSGSDSGDSSSSEAGEDGEGEEVIELLDDSSGDDAGEGGGGPSKRGPSHCQGGTLVVCPTTVLHQWANEIKSKTHPNAGINVHIYHGKGRLTSAASLSQYAVVLTTYATLAMEAPTKGAPVKKKKKAATAAEAAVKEEPGIKEEDGLIDLCADLGAEDEAGAGRGGAGTAAAAAAGVGPEDDKGGKKKRGRANAAAGEHGGPLYQVMWHRVVLDEAQCIKNRSTLAAHAAWSLKARRRWCLSGTPMQNSVDDLFSYFRFLKYEPYSQPGTFKEMIKDALAANPSLGYKRLQAILQGVVLRRTKQTTLDGEPLVKLPERRQALQAAAFSPGEAEFYRKLEKEAAEKMQRFQAEGTVRQNYVSILWMLLRLRQACNHPWLVKGSRHSYQHAHAAPASAEVHAAQKLPGDLRARLSNTLQEHLTECVGCGDFPEDPVISLCGHLFCAQCVSSNLTLAGHGAAEAELAYHCPSCGHTLHKHDVFTAEALKAAQSAGASGGPAGAEAPVGEAGAAGAAGGGEGGWQSSAKITALMELLQGLRSRKGSGEGGEGKRNVLTAARSLSHARLASVLKRGSTPPARSGGGGGGAGGKRPPLLMEKVIVFSQWTAMLDLVEVPLKKEGFQFRRLDGSMSVAARQAAIQDFSNRADIGVMLVSLKAASLGVNLVSANHVVLLDLWWNPTVEEQAIDRAHRIGQTKAVQVTRITIAGTVEDRILALQEKKRQMVAAAFGEDVAGGGGLGANRLTEADIAFLFQPVVRPAAPASAALGLPVGAGTAAPGQALG